MHQVNLLLKFAPVHKSMILIYLWLVLESMGIKLHAYNQLPRASNSETTAGKGRPFILYIDESLEQFFQGPSSKESIQTQGRNVKHLESVDIKSTGINALRQQVAQQALFQYLTQCLTEKLGDMTNIMLVDFNLSNKDTYTAISFIFATQDNSKLDIPVNTTTTVSDTYRGNLVAIDIETVATTKLRTPTIAKRILADNEFLTLYYRTIPMLSATSDITMPPWNIQLANTLIFSSKEVILKSWASGVHHARKLSLDSNNNWQIDTLQHILQEHISWQQQLQYYYTYSKAWQPVRIQLNYSHLVATKNYNSLSMMYNANTLQAQPTITSIKTTKNSHVTMPLVSSDDIKPTSWLITNYNAWGLGLNLTIIMPQYLVAYMLQPTMLQSMQLPLSSTIQSPATISVRDEQYAANSHINLDISTIARIISYHTTNLYLDLNNIEISNNCKPAVFNNQVATTSAISSMTTIDRTWSNSGYADTPLAQLITLIAPLKLQTWQFDNYQPLTCMLTDLLTTEQDPNLLHTTDLPTTKPSLINSTIYNYNHDQITTVSIIPI